jgi:general secretion pathway protein H
LIEVLFTLLLVSVVLAAVGVSAAGIFGGRMQNAASRMSAYIRYTYDQAALKGRPHRFMMDLSAGTFWIEAIEDLDDCKGRLSDIEAGGKGELKDPRGSAQEDMIVRKGKLPDGISFDGMLALHQREKVTEGEDGVMFFPDGTAERAFIWLASDNEVFTLEVSPIQGRGILHREELEPKDFERK